MTRARFCLLLVFLVLVSESPLMYGVKPGEIHTPLATVYDLLFANSALKFPIFFFITVGLLIAGRMSKKGPRPAAPMARAIWISIGALVSWGVLGVLRGGVFSQIPWQIFIPIEYMLFGLVLIDTLRTTADIEALGKVVLAAGVWRALVAVVYYLFVVRNITDWAKVPAYMTTHDDTTLFVTTIGLLVANAVHRWSRKSVLLAMGLIPLLLLAIQWNNRRLAWVSLMGVLIVVYVMLKPSKMRRRVNRWALAITPVILIYAAVGWGRSERIFKPLRAFATIDSKQDSSSASRDAENDGLVVTFGQGFFTGTGFGHKYIEVNNTFRLDGVFDQWAYIPHNSLMGLLAFMGIVGFAGAWLPLPVAVFLHGRAYRAAKKPIEQTAAMIGVAEIVVYANQMYGDMGFGSQTSLVLAVSAYAGAARLAQITGAWAPDKRAAVAKSTEQPSPSIPSESAAG